MKSEECLCELHTAEEQKEQIRKVFQMWHKRLLRSSAAHYMAATRFKQRETWLTLFNICAAIAVLFLSSNNLLQEYLTFSLGTNIGILLPLVSLLVVLSSAVQYIQQYSARVSEHKLAGNEFSNLRRKIERYWVKDSIHPEAIHALNRMYNSIAKYPPLVPEDIWSKSLEMKREECKEIATDFFALEGYVEFNQDKDLL